MRYTILYGVLFIVSGVGLLGLTAALSTRQTTHAPDGIPASPPPDEWSRRLFWGASVALAVMMLVSLLIGRAVANLVLRPLRRITAATRRISADNLHERLAVRGPADEVKALADTIDDLLERLEQAFAAQRRFVANASHELRTPMATMRAALDVAMAKPEPVPAVLADRLRTELDRVDGLLEGFLTLTRAQHGAFADRTEVTLGDLITAALRAAPDNGIQRYGSADAGATVIGNEVLLARMVSNVIENAFVHNVTGGWLRVVVTGPVLVVENSGPVLDPTEVSRLGRPFERLGTDRTGVGTGLGLSIVNAIATAHGGSLCVTARETGGLRVEITLPAPPSGPATRSSVSRAASQAAARPASLVVPDTPPLAPPSFVGAAASVPLHPAGPVTPTAPESSLPAGSAVPEVPVLGPESS
jgi:signal transduction histidine kinase